MHQHLYCTGLNLKLSGFWAKLYIDVRVPSPGDSGQHGRDAGSVRLSGGGWARTVVRDTEEFPKS